MTIAEAKSIQCCPICGAAIMKVPETGLVACLASLKFDTCRWNDRSPPYELEHRKDTMTRREKERLELQARIDKMREETNET